MCKYIQSYNNIKNKTMFLFFIFHFPQADLYSLPKGEG